MTGRSPLRVAIVNETADPRRGGAETSIREMAGQLVRLGVDLTLVFAGEATTPSRSAAAGATIAARDASIRETALPAHGVTRNARTVNFISEADAYCRAEAFDVVHAVTPLPCATVYQPRGGTYVETIARSNALAGRSWRGVVSRIGRTFNRKQQRLLRMERELLSRREPPFVAAVSEYVARQVRDAYATPAERVRVVFNGVNPPTLNAAAALETRRRLRDEAGISGHAPVVLMLAHNFKLKGLRELLLATATPGAARPWTLVVVGRDDQRRYRKLAGQLRISDRVHFIGAAKPADWLASADALAHPTWYDPCSRVVLEAAACGLPVVTTRYNGAAEILESGKTGVVVSEPDDIAALARGIQDCLQPEIAAAADAAAGAIREHVSMARHARELVELYADVRRSRFPAERA